MHFGKIYFVGQNAYLADSKPSNGIGKDAEEILQKRNIASKENDEIVLTVESENINEEKRGRTNRLQESFIKVKKKLSENLFQSQVSPVFYVQKMTEKGFSTEQITFILDCIDAGMHKRDLDNIAISPKLSIEMMEKLKKMQLEKRKEYQKNGK